MSRVIVPDERPVRPVWSWSCGKLIAMVGHLLVLVAAVVSSASAQAAASGSITGIVQSAGGATIGGSVVTLSGPATSTTRTDSAGAFAFHNIAPGLYTVTAGRSGYVSVEDDSIVVAAGTSVTVRLTLTATSFDSLKEIGRVASSQGRAVLNTSTAAVTTVDAQTFIDQGQTQQIMQVLNEVPGVNFQPSQANGAFLGTAAALTIRGSLPYETQTLIDGHPVSIGAAGYFAPNYLSPYLLQSVEVVKGPGATVPDINYAINGSVNYITLNPTRTPQFSIDAGYDGYGGQQENFRATGTIAHGKLGYALDLSLQGTPGEISGNFLANADEIFPGFATINGQTVCPNGPTGTNVCGRSYADYGCPSIQGCQGFAITSPIAFCCQQYSLSYVNRAYLAKLRYDFSPSTTLTASYLGGSTVGNLPAYNSVNDPTNLFLPPSGYTGTNPAPGSALFADDTLGSQGTSTTHQGLVQGEIRTAIGNDTLLGRYYAGSTYTYDQTNPNVGTASVYNFTAYGGISLGPNDTVNIFNATPAVVNYGYIGYQSTSLDAFRGYSVEYDHPSGNNIYTVSYDQSHHDSFAETYFDPLGPFGAFSGYSIVPGSGETFGTLMLRGSLQLSPKLQLVAANYLETYTTRSTPDGGVTFISNTSHVDVPRLGMTYRANPDAIARFAAGGSLAPPYTNLLATSAIPPTYQFGGFYTQALGNATLKPESAFGYDLGFDDRIRPLDAVASVDLYYTTLYSQYYTRETLSGTFNDGIDGEAPLFTTQTNNIGFSRYSGLEFSLKRVVPRGFGFTTSLDFTRAYPFDIPAGFYDTAAGPLTTNLAVVANANYFANGPAGTYNALGSLYGYGAVPYASGYGELNYTLKGGTRVAVGTQYEGNNNVLNEPPYGLVSASLRIPVAPRSYLLVSGNNLTDVYPQTLPNLVGGRLTPLVNGKFGWTIQGNVGPPTFSAVLHIGL